MTHICTEEKVSYSANNEEKVLKIINIETDLPKEETLVIVNSFEKLMGSFSEWKQAAQQITIDPDDPKDGMAAARKLKLIVKKAKSDVEKKRVELKAHSIKYGKAVQSVANDIKDYLLPIINDLQEKEDHIKKIEADKRAKITAERVEKLTPYVDDVSVFDLDGMTDIGFNGLLEGMQAKKEQEERRIKEEEEERLRIERKQEEERRELQLENERLKEADRLRAEKHEKILKKFIHLGLSFDGEALIYTDAVRLTVQELLGLSDEDLQNKYLSTSSIIRKIKEEAAAKAEQERIEREAAEEQERIDREAREEEARIEREKEAAQLKAETEAKEAAERKLREIEEQKERERKAAAEEKERRLAAGDDEKVATLISDLQAINIPKVSSQKFEKAVVQAEVSINGLIMYLTNLK